MVEFNGEQRWKLKQKKVSVESRFQAKMQRIVMSTFVIMVHRKEVFSSIHDKIQKTFCSWRIMDVITKSNGQIKVAGIIGWWNKIM